ncbi:MAG: acyltransferase [Giesbergeria sp.]|uniref:acyltransferase family protein n=1 Tax=Giesbergeria sp. TaxID=2818473 RepID=UPI00260F2888|nr:acyltransferase [Giesbergeria sp.]MDD2608377.1 acyltransferase [Giesbergeria sp.]
MEKSSVFNISENVKSIFDNSRQNNIDLLRCIAVAAVFIHHAQHTFGGNFPFLGSYGGQFGPQLFFLISGYLITVSCQKHSLRDYFFHRSFRILPAYLFFFLTIGFVSGGINISKILQFPGYFFANLVLWQQLFPSALLTFDVLHVTWTLTVEVLWYALAPLILWLLKGSVRWPAVLFFAVFSSLWSYFASQRKFDFLFPGVTDSNPGFSYLFLGNHFFSQICFFILGSWIYSHREKLKTWNPITGFVLGSMIFMLMPYYMVFNPIFITGVGLTYFMIAAINSTSIKNRLVFFISETSYSIYLCHFPIILWVRHSLGLDSFAGVGLSLLLTILIAFLSFIFIEKPGMKVGRFLTKK